MGLSALVARQRAAAQGQRLLPQERRLARRREPVFLRRRKTPNNAHRRHASVPQRQGTTAAPPVRPRPTSGTLPPPGR